MDFLTSLQFRGICVCIIVVLNPNTNHKVQSKTISADQYLRTLKKVFHVEKMFTIFSLQYFDNFLDNAENEKITEKSIRGSTHYFPGEG